MISPYAHASTVFCAYEDFQTAAVMLKNFCLKRAESVTRQLNDDTTQEDASELELSVMGTMALAAVSAASAAVLNAPTGTSAGMVRIILLEHQPLIQQMKCLCLIWLQNPRRHLRLPCVYPLY